MDRKRTDLSGRFRMLRDVFAENLPQKITGLFDSWKEVTKDTTSLDSLKQLQRMVSTVSGSGASFGFQLISNQSRQLERFLKDLVKKAVPLNSKDKEEVEKRVQDLAKLLGNPGTDSDSPLKSPLKWILTSASQWSQSRLIFFLSDTQSQGQEMSSQLDCFGYEVQLFSQFEDILKASKDQDPKAILVDGSLLNNDPEMVLALKRLAAEQSFAPMIVVGSADDLNIRLKAIRAGAGSYFAEPIDVSQLVDQLDQITGGADDEPYRVLIVEEEKSEANYYGAILEAAGLETVIVTEPLKIMEPLSEFRPDLILMDLYLSECSGQELAAVLRQQDRFLTIPLIFLSTEVDRDKQLELITVGADDFLTKPVAGENLLCSVNSRIRRARQLRSLAQHDSLTGLLKHSSIKDQLGALLQRAQRQKTPLSLAFLDVDHFKNINDSYGHLTGDQILIVLSRLLKQRLRKSDIIGRYGGDEFAIILPDTESKAGYKVFNEICRSFAALKQHIGKNSFNVTLSCGLVSLSGEENAAELIEKADKALYKAKEQGRNQVAWL
jgi:diguanylate cyclase (GGDEF)-like protein